MTLAAATVVFFPPPFFCLSLLSQNYVFSREKERDDGRKGGKKFCSGCCVIFPLFSTVREIALIWETTSRRRRPGANYSAIQKEGWLGHKGTKTEKKRGEETRVPTTQFLPSSRGRKLAVKRNAVAEQTNLILQKKRAEKIYSKKMMEQCGMESGSSLHRI